MVARGLFPAEPVTHKCGGSLAKVGWNCLLLNGQSETVMVLQHTKTALKKYVIIQIVKCYHLPSHWIIIPISTIWSESQHGWFILSIIVEEEYCYRLFVNQGIETCLKLLDQVFTKWLFWSWTEEDSEGKTTSTQEQSLFPEPVYWP